MIRSSLELTGCPTEKMSTSTWYLAAASYLSIQPLSVLSCAGTACVCRFASDVCRSPLTRPNGPSEVEGRVGVSVRVFLCVGLGPENVSLGTGHVSWWVEWFQSLVVHLCKDCMVFSEEENRMFFCLGIGLLCRMTQGTPSSAGTSHRFVHSGCEEYPPI